MRHLRSVSCHWFSLSRMTTSHPLDELKSQNLSLPFSPSIVWSQYQVVYFFLSS